MLIQLEAPEGTPVFFQVGGEPPPPPRRDGAADAVRGAPDVRFGPLEAPSSPRPRRALPLLAASAAVAVAFFAGLGVGRSTGGGPVPVAPAEAAADARPPGALLASPDVAVPGQGARRDTPSATVQWGAAPAGAHGGTPPSRTAAGSGAFVPRQEAEAHRAAEVPQALRRAMEAPPAVLSPPGAGPGPAAAAGTPRDAFGLEAPRR